ncbi:MAG: hypothetical protein K2L28_00215 [Muribaculaceae bacterium]|nr:hypothetical protein [Muribaculaceae bacterium]
MKITRYICLSLAAALLCSCGAHDHSDGHEAAEAGHEHKHGEIELHDHSAELLGVRVDTLRRTDFHSVLTTSGIVLQSSDGNGIVSAPTSGIVRFAKGIGEGSSVGKGALVATVSSRDMSGGDRDAAAAAALESATAELKRVEALYAEKLATQAELNAARAAFSAAQAAYSPKASSGRALAPMGGTLTSLLVGEGQYVEAGEAIASVGNANGTVLRVDLPRRYYSQASGFGDVTVDFASGTTFRASERHGKRLGSAAGANEARSGYIPLYFSVSACEAPAGTPFTAHLTGERRAAVLTVPLKSLSEQQGIYFIYVATSPEHYAKHPVRLVATDGITAEIEGVEEGIPFVSDGVTAVRLAELSAAAPQGHTHNH